ncbi:MAG: hypothetical protein J5U19_06560 [Candidatus Methanoperedens sp.]|nr:hypothetical protein [Candidatus Methanoperedens sp.]
MSTELLSLAKYLAASRSEFELSELNQYLSKKYSEKELYELLKPHFYDLDLFCESNKCTKLVKHALQVDEAVIGQLEAQLKNPALTPRIEKLIGSYIERKCGRNWYTGGTGQLIRENIVKQKEEYWKGKAQYPRIRMISYLLYHFPVYFCQFQYLLLDLLKVGLLTNKMSILDVGSGPGTITLSTLDFLKKLQDVYSSRKIDEKLNIIIDSIEPVKENIDCYIELTSDYLGGVLPGNTMINLNKPVHMSVEKAKLSKGFDLLVFSNILAEMKAPPQHRADAIEKLAAGKNPAVIIIEPADLVNSKALRISQSALIRKGFTVYSPCTSIWGIMCDCRDCWSFREAGHIRVPGFMRTIAGTDVPYRYINTDMKFSYVVLRKDGLTEQKYQAKGKFIRLSNLKKHIKKRINVVASVMSGNLGDEKNFVFKLCDSTSSIPVYAVLPYYHMTEKNRQLFDAAYGNIIEIFGSLVRENAELSSFNLLITRNTSINLVHI